MVNITVIVKIVWLVMVSRIGYAQEGWFVMVNIVSVKGWFLIVDMVVVV